MSEPIFQIEEQDTTTDNYGKFEITPLEQGYGNTLGNSLRRVLLMSLPGVAITEARISGVKHQFSTLKGMKEDVLELLLNLKQVRFSVEGKDASQLVDDEYRDKVTLSVKSEGEVKAGDIEVPAGLSVANPDLVLATLNKDAKLEAEMVVEAGVGYSPAEDREGSKEVGLIHLDATFSPIKRVDYEVEETRVGRLTNYDKLIIEVTTDGSIKPKDALVKASKILVTYFHQVVSPKEIEEETDGEESEDSLGPVGKLSVEEIGLPTRVANALVKADIHTVEDLANTEKEDLMKVRNLGEKSLKIIQAALGEKGIEYSLEE